MIDRLATRMSSNRADGPRRGTCRRLIFWLCGWMAAGVVALATAEAAVRVVWSPAHPAQPNVYVFDERVGLMHRPGRYLLPFRRCSVGPPGCEDVRVRLSVNGQGFRSIRDFEPVGGKPLVVVLGDSMIEAAQVDDDRTAVARLEAALKRKLPDAEVRNLGVTSAGFVHYYMRWQWFARAMRPDVLVIAVTGLNDFRNSSAELETFEAMRPHYVTNPQSGLQVQFERRPNAYPAWRRVAASLWQPLELHRFYRWWVAALAEAAPQNQGVFTDWSIYEDPPSRAYADAIALGREFLDRVIREAKADGIRVVVVYIPWQGEGNDDEWQRWVRRYENGGGKSSVVRTRPEQITRAAAEENGAAFVSFTAAVRSMPGSPNEAIWNTATDSHLSDRGNERLAELLAATLTR